MMKVIFCWRGMARILFFASFGFTAQSFPQLAVAADQRATKIIANAIENAWLPAALRFNRDTSVLRTVSASCDAASLESWPEAKQAFSRTVTSFSGLEYLRIGPLLEDNRLNRLFYWPDSRRVGERQLRKLLADKAVESVSAAGIHEKSVAIQGLPAIERLIYGVASVTTDNQRACILLQALAAHIDDVAEQLSLAWQDKNGFRQLLLKPGKDNPRFRSGREVVQVAVTQISTALVSIIEQKITPMLANNPLQIRKSAFWRSRSTVANLQANLGSLRLLLVDSGLAASAGHHDELEFEFGVAATLLQKLASINPLVDNSGKLPAEAVDLLHTLNSVLSSIATTVGERVAPALGVTRGFNSANGD